MYVCGQHFSQSILDRIQETVRREPSVSRLDLSRRVCEWLNWRSPNGRLQDMSCRKALAQLNHRGLLDLPLRERPCGFESSGGHCVEPDITELCCTLRELGEITVEPVSSRYAKESKDWFALLDKYHYLGSGRCVAPRSDTLSRVRVMAILGLWPSVRHPGRSSVETTILDGQKTLAEPT